MNMDVMRLVFCMAAMSFMVLCVYGSSLAVEVWDHWVPIDNPGIVHATQDYVWIITESTENYAFAGLAGGAVAARWDKQTRVTIIKCVNSG